jgi:uncharacterized protein YndB with AHSA1/START domain
MTTEKTITTTEGRDLILTRVINAAPESVFQAWTEPVLLKQWFAPLPWTTPVVEADVRAGGSCLMVMRGPDGNEFPNRGVYLEVVKNRRLELFSSDWISRSRVGLPVEQGAATRRSGATARSRNAVPQARRPAAASQSGENSSSLPMPSPARGNRRTSHS